MRFTGARVISVALAAALVSWAPSVAAAAPSPTPNPQPSDVAASPQPKKGTPVCTITDKNAIELSGLAAAKGFLYAVNDSTNNSAMKKVYKFNPSTCALVGTPIGYPTGPLDPEDLAIGPDGTIWIADTGDNDLVRKTVALWKIVDDKIDGPYRMAYPDAKAHDAEALLIDGQGNPVIITKAVNEPTTQVFTLASPLDKASKEGVPLKAAGEVTLPKTTTENPLNVPGRSLVTGAATSPDRSSVVLRTYADAFEYPVANGDVVGAITKGTPKVTPLPMEPWGEAISYTPDGKNFLTVSDVGGLGENRPKPAILSYVPNTEVYKAPGTGNSTATVPAPAKKAWWSSLISSTKRLYMLIGAVGVLGLMLVLFGVLGIARSRRRRRREAEEAEEEEQTRMLQYPPQGYYDQGYGQQQQGYGYSQQPGYGYPQQGGYPEQPYYPDQGGYPQQPQQPGYGYPQQPPYPEQYPPQNYPDQGYGQQQGYR